MKTTEKKKTNTKQTDTELENFLNKAIEKIMDDNDEGNPLSETYGSMTKQLQTNKHKITPEGENINEKRKKVILPDYYNEKIEVMVEEMDYVEEVTDEKIMKTPSMKKILKNKSLQTLKFIISKKNQQMKEVIGTNHEDANINSKNQQIQKLYKKNNNKNQKN